MKKISIKLLSVFMALFLLLSVLPVPALAAASKTVDLNQNFLFRKNMPVQIQGVSDKSETNIYKLTYTPQYTATYTLKFYGRIGSINGANINTWGRLYDGDGNLLAEAEYETLSSEYIPSYLDYPNGTITYRLEKGKSYYYEIEGFFSTRTYTVYIDLTSDESGLLDAENGLKVRLNKVEFDEYSPQTLLDNLFLILYDADKNSFVWRYKDAGGNLLFNGADVIIDMSECGKCGENTVRVHYLGYEATTNFVINHDYSQFIETVSPTGNSQGYDVYACSRCGEETQTNFTDYDGYVISTAGTDMGDIRFDAQNVTAGGSLDVDRGMRCTLFAQPNPGCKFVGWQYNGKIVSTLPEYTFKPFVSGNYEPVFIDESNLLTFLFVDNYANILSYQQVDDASKVVLPEPPDYRGYTFVGWSYSAEEIHRSKTSLTVHAVFEKDSQLQCKVEAQGCTLSALGQTAQNSISVPYGTKVTVQAADATAFLSGEDVLAYASSYSFYAAADVTLTKSSRATESRPTVAALSCTLADGGSAEFIAGRSMQGAAGCKLVASGFVFGKNMNPSDLCLENVGKQGTGTDSGIVKSAVCASTAGDAQFVMRYGIRSRIGSACAKAFLTYEAPDGELVTIYSSMLQYTY